MSAGCRSLNGQRVRPDIDHPQPDARPAFDDDGRGLTVDLQAVEVRGDAQSLKHPVANLLENILAHAGKGMAAKCPSCLGCRGSPLMIARMGASVWR
jgi:hypothetical protein